MIRQIRFLDSIGNRKSSLIRSLFFSVCLLLYFGHGHAQNKDYIITQYTTENGLPQNSINGVAIDELGYAWIGTENGLVKYDGIRFRLFDNFDVAPPSARVTSIRQNREKDILVSFEGNHDYVIKNNRYFGTRPVSIQKRFFNGTGYDFREIKDRTLAELIRLIPTANSNFFIKDDGKIFMIKNDSLWIYTPGGHLKMMADPAVEKFQSVLVDGILVMITGNNTAQTLENGEGNFKQLSTKGAFFRRLDVAAGNFSLIYSATGTYGFCEGKLYKLKISEGIIQSTLVLSDINVNSIFAVLYDTKTDTYYLQSRIDGLFIAKPNRFTTARIPESMGTWRENTFYGQNKYGANKILANGFIFSFDKDTVTIKKSFKTKNPFSTIIDDNFCYYEDDNKLLKRDIQTNKNSVIYDLRDYAHCFRRSEYDNLIYFTSSDRVFSLINDTPKLLIKLPKSHYQYIYSFNFVNKDSILIATNLGLLGGNIRTGRVAIAIPDINIRNIYQGKDDYVWLGTYNHGIFIMKGKRYMRLPIDLNKRLSVINSIFEDKLGRIWFSTNNGLLYTDKKSIVNYFQGKGDIAPYVIFDKSDGLITNEFNGGATPDKVYLSDGRISIPSLKSLVIFDPERFPNDTVYKHVYIEKIEVDDRNMTDLSDIVLHPDYRAMIISVSTPWKNKAESLNYESRITGSRSGWISSRYGEDISIRGLGHGTYNLKIRIKGQPKSEIEIAFTVAPYFYENLWFKIGMAFIFLLLISYIFYFIIKKYKRENTTLDKRIKERTSELNQSLESLNETVKQLQDTESRLQTSVLQKDQIINMLLHDMKSPLFALRNGIEELDYKLNLESNISTEVLRKSNLIREGISDVYSFSVNFFEWVKYQKEGIKANYQLTHLSRVYETINELYGGIGERKGVRLLIEYRDISFFTDENILITILRNLVDNAIKNTTAGATIRLSTDVHVNKYLTITLHDSGPGMPDKLLDSIQNAFDEEKILDDQIGYGYKLILHLIQLIHGDIELENDNGLKVKIMLNYMK